MEARQSKQQAEQQADDEGAPVSVDSDMEADHRFVLGFEDQIQTTLQQDAAGLQLVPVPFPPAVGCHALEKPLLEQACATIPEYQRTLLDNKFPISVSALKDRLCQAGCTLESDVKDFKSKASHLTSGSTIPGRFKFPKPCVDMCMSCNTHRSLNFHRRIREALLAVASHFAPNKKMNLVSQAELVIAVESFETLATPKTVLFLALCSGSGRQAHHPARANFVQLLNPAQQAGRMVCCDVLSVNWPMQYFDCVAFFVHPSLAPCMTNIAKGLLVVMLIII